MSYQFKASHITSGNMLFPDKLEIDDEKVTFYKAKLIGHESTVIQRSAIGSVSLNAGLLSSSRPKADSAPLPTVLPAPTPNAYSSCLYSDCCAFGARLREKLNFFCCRLRLFSHFALAC